MSCCGQKRREWEKEVNRSFDDYSVKDMEPQSEAEANPKVFEYVGNGGLILRGVSSGTKYHFQFKGERIEVNYFDSFALMAERDLKIAS
jgi:hypothetical protein